ncbi:MAG: bifunctional 5,10-methylenetetrahydrofolate dehydrogenase/5,10-methenyltetrahydrofolate cyclohydrolase [Actinomycetota bacterium]
MAAHVIDGNRLASQLRETIDEELQVLRMSAVTPGLATIMVGEEAGASAYERHVRRLAEGLEYHYVSERLPPDVELADVLATIGKVNADPRVTGVLVLRPLPAHLDEAVINATVDPRKDIEGQHPENAGLLALGRPRFVPSTPASCFYLLDSYAQSTGVDPSEFYVGKTLVVVGRSTSVGKPAMWLGLERHATVLAAHSRTAASGRLAEATLQADILIVAAGQPCLVTGDMVCEGVVAVDVGFHTIDDPETGKTRFVGDLDFDSVAAKAEAITPVPGGVGPITDVWLVGNTLVAAALSVQVEPRFGSIV